MRRLMVLAAAAFSAAGAEDGETFLRQFLQESPSAKIAFVQKSLEENGNVISEVRGQFWYRRPGLFRMEYEAPDELLVVSDGGQNWTYQADLNQVIVRTAESLDGASAILEMLSTGELAPLEKRYLFFSGTEDNLHWFNAEASENGAAIRRFRMGFLADGKLRRMELRDSFGNSAVLDVQLVSREELDDKLFQFTPPVGADIVRE